MSKNKDKVKKELRKLFSQFTHGELVEKICELMIENSAVRAKFNQREINSMKEYPKVEWPWWEDKD